jgi:transcriptional regulator with XRE-family HTH domain
VRTELSTPTIILSELFDELKQKQALTSDAQLSAKLGVTRGYVCSVRKGRKRISLELLKKIYSILDRTFEMKGLEQLFLPEKVQRHTSNMRIVKDVVILRAAGHCQLCGTPAPFKLPDGQPYLELHHVQPIREGVADSQDNVVALCPNCHRKVEINPTDADIKKLQKVVKRYKKRIRS